MRQENKRLTEKRQADKLGRHEWLAAIRLPLLRYCLRMTGSRWEAEDLVQDTMARLLKAEVEQPEREVGFRYACRTARNLWIDRCRRAKRETVIAQTDAADLAVEGGEVLEGGCRGTAGGRVTRVSAGSTHARAYTSTDAAMDVREHLEELAWRLSPKPFVILLLMEVFDFTAKETAAWLGGTEVAVQVALSRARKRLQSLSRSARDDGGHAGGKLADTVAAGRAPIPAAFFEAVVDAFRRRHPAAIQEAYLSMVASGGQLQGIRALGASFVLRFRTLMAMC